MQELGVITSLPEEVPSRVGGENVQPSVDGGRFPVKRTVGEELTVSADVHTDGHEVLAAVLRHRPVGAADWLEVGMAPAGNDRGTASFALPDLGRHEYTVQAWIDPFAGWRRDLVKRVEARQDVTSELLEGAEMVRQAARRAGGADGEWLAGHAEQIGGAGADERRTRAALDQTLAAMMARHADRAGGVELGRPLEVLVEQERARYGAWYELFPRSCAATPGAHGTFADVEKRLPYVAAMGFDVLYLPPIHPIGRAFRKGPNNTLDAGPDDPGSPWAIGAAQGGHKSFHPALGTQADFDRLLAAAKRLGIDIALDIAFQCSPDHPYVREHPGWFRHRPDGTIKYADNPPKKYQDIYPLFFECPDWKGLWAELLDVMLFWCGRGVRIFRVDNPHTKPVRFWEWLIAQVRRRHPDTVYLSEAFTRPKVMRQLAKAGFSQSYTYFTWRNTKPEITEYFTELTQTPVREYMRPNLFANTPDILPEFLWHQGRPAFAMRFLLAATLGASYGIYGPAFEECESRPQGKGEEYLDSEKYQLRRWNWDAPNVFREFIGRVNRIRRENPALHHDHRLRFHGVDNERLLFFSKTTPDLSNIILVVGNLDPHHAQSGWVRVPLAELGLDAAGSFQAHDLVTDARFLWHGEATFVKLDPAVCPGHVFRLRRKEKTEHDFDYFL